MSLCETFGDGSRGQTRGEKAGDETVAGPGRDGEASALCRNSPCEIMRLLIPPSQDMKAMSRSMGETLRGSASTEILRDADTGVSERPLGDAFISEPADMDMPHRLEPRRTRIPSGSSPTAPK
jgi:hypothetical protein